MRSLVFILRIYISIETTYRIDKIVYKKYRKNVNIQ